MVKLPILIILQYKLLLNAIRLTKHVIKLPVDIFLHLFIFLIDIKLKKFVTVALKDSFLIVYCPEKYINQNVCDEAVADCLAALKFVADWLVTRKMYEIFGNGLLAYDDVLFFNENLNKFTFIPNQSWTFDVDLDEINLDNDND